MIGVQIIGIDRARTRIADLADQVQAGPITVTRNGEAAMVWLAPEDYESMIATVELLQNPEYVRQRDAILSDAGARYVPDAEVEPRLRSKMGEGG